MKNCSILQLQYNRRLPVATRGLIRQSSCSIAVRVGSPEPPSNLRRTHGDKTAHPMAIIVQLALAACALVAAGEDADATFSVPPATGALYHEGFQGGSELGSFSKSNDSNNRHNNKNGLNIQTHKKN